MMPTIVIFGASEGGRLALRDWPADLPVSYFVDNDPAKWGRIVGGLPVRNPQVLEAELSGRLFVVVASSAYDEICTQLESLGLVNGEDFAWTGHALPILRREPPPASPHATVMQLEDYWFGVDYARLRQSCEEAGIRYVSARVAHTRPPVPVAIDRESYRTVRYCGVPLYDASVFDTCVTLRVTPDRLDPDDPTHWQSIDEHMRCAAAAAQVVSKALDRVRPDAIVIPQGHITLGAVYRYLAVLRGIRVLALENSFNNTRMVWDDLAGIAVNKIPARNYYWRWTDLVDADEAAAHVRAYLSSVKDGKRDDHRSPQTQWSGSSTPGRTVLYLANVLTDSSILFNSRVGSQVEAIKTTARWALANGCTFVLKIHPRERPGSPMMRRHFPPAEFSYEGLTVAALQADRAFWELASRSDRCVIDHDNRFDTYGLIRQSDVCVTVCSQAGLEALMMGKETVVLGDAYYGGLGFTHDVHHLDQIGAALHTALTPEGRRAAPSTVAKFFYIFDQLYCIEKSTDGVADLIRRTLGRARLPVLPATA